MADPDKQATAAPRRPAILFLIGLALVALAAIAALSFASPLARDTDPETQNAYVGGDTVTLASHVQGYLRLQPVTDNQQVRAGQLIAAIEDADFRASRDQAQADLEAAVAALASLDRQRDALLAQIAQTRVQTAGTEADITRTSPELARQRALLHTDAGVLRALQQAQAQQDRTHAEIEAGRAQLRARQVELDTLAAQRRQAEAEIDARQAALRLAELNLAWCRITAPSDGMLGARRLREGDLVSPGAALNTLVPLATVWIDANYKERQIALIRLGQPATIHVDAFPDQSLRGHVAGFAPATGQAQTSFQPDNTTGNFTKVAQRVTVRIAIDWNGSTLLGLIRPGMSTRVIVHTGGNA